MSTPFLLFPFKSIQHRLIAFTIIGLMTACGSTKHDGSNDLQAIKDPKVQKVNKEDSPPRGTSKNIPMGEQLAADDVHDEAKQISFGDPQAQKIDARKERIAKRLERLRKQREQRTKRREAYSQKGERKEMGQNKANSKPTSIPTPLNAQQIQKLDTLIYQKESDQYMIGQSLLADLNENLWGNVRFQQKNKTNGNPAIIKQETGDQEVDGMRITRIRRKSLLWKIGLKNGDIIIAVNDQKITSEAELKKANPFTNAGFSIRIVRRLKERKLNYSIYKDSEVHAQKPIQAATTSPKIQQIDANHYAIDKNSLTTLSPKTVRLNMKKTGIRGVRVSGIRRNSPWYQLGFRNSDIIQSINGKNVRLISTSELLKFYEIDLQSQEQVTVELMRATQQRCELSRHLSGDYQSKTLKIKVTDAIPADLTRSTATKQGDIIINTGCLELVHKTGKDQYLIDDDLGLAIPCNQWNEMVLSGLNRESMKYKLGLKNGDVITAFNGKLITDKQSLVSTVCSENYLSNGLTIEILRRNNKRTLEYTVFKDSSAK